MADDTLLAAQTGAGQSNSFKVRKGQQKRIYAYPVADLTASEDVGDLQFKDVDGTWADHVGYLPDGNKGKVTLSDTMYDFVVIAEGEWRIDKGVTTNAIGIGIADQGYA